MLSYLQFLDEQFLLFVQNTLRFSPILDNIMIFITSLGDGGILFILLSCVLMLFKKTRRIGFFALLSLALGALCTNVALKQIISRPRPNITIEALMPLLPSHDPFSMPSGHTTAAFAWCTAIYLQVKNKWYTHALMVFAALMGISRVYVGVHYLSDVIVAVFVGTFSAIAVCAFAKSAFIARFARSSLK